MNVNNDLCSNSPLVQKVFQHKAQVCAGNVLSLPLGREHFPHNAVQHIGKLENAKTENGVPALRLSP